MPKLIVLIDAELDETLTTFEKQENRLANKGKPLIDKNMPAIAGQLALSHELKHGMTTNIKGFTELTHPIIKTKEAADIVNKFKVLLKRIDDYEENVFLKWAFAAEKITEKGLNLPLIVREKDQTLKVNFGKQTLNILSEVKNLRRDFPERPVPQKAGEIFRRFEEYRKYNNSLDQMVYLYNFVKLNVNQYELKLIEREFADIDKELEPAEKTLNWKKTPCMLPPMTKKSLFSSFKAETEKNIKF